MSRSFRGTTFRPRWGKVAVAKNMDTSARESFLVRQLRRELINAPEQYWSYDFTHGGVRYTGRVKANTRSEARSMIKKELGLKRVPVGATITKKFAPKRAADVE